MVEKDLNISSQDKDSFLGQGFTSTIWAQKGHKKFDDPTCSTFLLANGSLEKDNNKQTSFYIEQRKADVRPRVIMGSKNPSYWTYLNFSRRAKDGVNDPQRGLFKIVKY